MKANSKEIVCSLVKRMTKMDTMCTYLPTFR